MRKQSSCLMKLKLNTILCNNIDYLRSSAFYKMLYSRIILIFIIIIHIILY